VEREERGAGAGRRVVVIGDEALSEETGRALEALGAQVDYLSEPDEDAVSDALEGSGVDSVAVVGRTDAVVLRVGDGAVANETRSLLALGVVRDVHRIAAALLATMVLGQEPESVVCLGDDAHVRFPDGRLERGVLDTLAG
jgi:hypothetical protein